MQIIWKHAIMKHISEVNKMKRSDVLTWDEYFMGLAHLSAKRSKDPNTQVGAAIVNDQHKVVSIGYNGFPNGCHDDDLSLIHISEPTRRS